MPDVEIVNAPVPYHYEPRSYQREFFNELYSGRKKRAILVWHRRAGKDKSVLNLTIAKMLQRVGAYYYFFPTYTQGKKILWDGRGADGFKFMDHFPPDLVENKWEDELKVLLKNGSIFQIIGTDKLDSIRGTNPIGCVFSEYAMMNPLAWDITRPILRENGGWAVFVYTPMGKNHGWRLWHKVMAAHQRVRDQWYTSLLTIRDTRRDAPGESGGPVMSENDVADEIAEGLDEALAQQEFYCSWEGFMRGSYYGDLIARLRAEGRIGNFPFDPHYSVDTAWDVGVDDATAIVFTQTIRGVPRLIDYFEAVKNTKSGMPWYAKFLRTEKSDYRYGLHFAPHDMKVTEFSTGNTRVESASDLGVDFEVVPKLKIEDGIDATRKLLAKCVINEATTERLVDCLNFYHREWDDETQTWEPKPKHDWSSHGSDALRTRAVAYQDPYLSSLAATHARMRFDVMGDPEQAEAEMQRGPLWQRWPRDGRWQKQQPYAEM